MLTLSVEDPRWFEFVSSCADASPFHHPMWAGLLARCYDYRAVALAVEDEAGRIQAGLPMVEVRRPLKASRWVSLPFTDYCPPLGEGLAEINLAGEMLPRGAKSLEVRAGLPPASRVHPSVRAVRHTTVLSDDASEVYARFSRMHRRNIRKAERDGVQVERTRSLSAMQVFYRLHLLTRRRLGVPVQPFNFFRLLLDRMVQADFGFILVARVNGEPAAAAVFLTYNGVMVYKYGASDPRFWDSRPNNLLFWRAIHRGCEDGYHTFDWGRTDLEDDGLREFKMGWGATEYALIYTVIADVPPGDSHGRLEQAVGAVIRPSPLWVCRAIGELFYKYAA